MKSRSHWWALVLALGAGMACGDATPDIPAQAEQAEAAGPAAGTSDSAESNVVFVDVRTEAEYAAGHVEGAIHIPHTEMSERYTELEQYEDREIVLYCRSGRRSGIALDILESQGFENATNGGGLSDLQARGVPTTR